MNRFKTYLKLFFLVICAFAFSQCTKQELYSVGVADFTVKNLSTGESVKGSTIYLGKGLSVRNGDELELAYEPKAVYAQYEYDVVFNVFNTNKAVSGSPYTVKVVVENMPADTYVAKCTAVYEAKNESIRDFAVLNIEVVE